MSESITCYRFVTEDLRSENGDEQWSIGEWKKVDGELELCRVGLHACRTPYQSINYVYGTRWFKAEARGNILEYFDKFCASEMRLIKEIPITVIHQWMVDCAYRVLPIYEQQHPEDNRPRKALEAKQAWIDNPCEETARAAKAAWDAVKTADDAAWAAWAAVKTADDAAWAAWAASVATKATAWDAAKDADAIVVAWDEWKWQSEHLEELIQETVK